MNDNGILEIFKKKSEYDEKYKSLVYEFITKATVAVTITNGEYQIENSIRGNKISLKDYILRSDLCNILKSRNINDYSIEELKKYMQMYEMQNPMQVYPYKVSLELYELLDKIENIEDEKIDYEIDSMKKYLNGFNNIKKTNKSNLKGLYDSIIVDLKSKNYDGQSYNYFIVIIDDIFSFYFLGHKKIKI